MIKSLRLQHFHFTQSIVLKELNQINILVGRNGSGKSLVLKAIEEVYQQVLHSPTVVQAGLSCAVQIDETPLTGRLGVLDKDTLRLDHMLFSPADKTVVEEICQWAIDTGVFEDEQLSDLASVFYLDPTPPFEGAPVASHEIVFPTGAHKVIGTLLAIHHCQDGILLIDAIESDIYYKAWGKFFSRVVEDAQRYRCQLFITTQSQNFTYVVPAVLLHKPPEIRNQTSFVRMKRTVDNHSLGDRIEGTYQTIFPESLKEEHPITSKRKLAIHLGEEGSRLLIAGEDSATNILRNLDELDYHDNQSKD